jgi:F-type H+-transporting ATPase subunit delta
VFGLAQARGTTPQVGEELEELVRLAAAAPELRMLLERPDLAVERKLEALREGLGPRFSQTVTALVAGLVRHGRGDSIGEVAEAYGELADEAAGVARAEARTVVPLSATQRARLAAGLERLTGKRVRLEDKIDPTVLAGVRLQVGDRLIDGSAAGRLARMREELMGHQGRSG